MRRLESGQVPQGACRILVTGRVQGVGFRPFVYRLAHRHGLAGEVRNLGGQVAIEVEGPIAAIEAFVAALTREAPPLAAPVLGRVERLPLRGVTDFVIAESLDECGGGHLPPDGFCCDDCLRELASVHDRRYRHPFVNCTQCGPRYTVISALPYDRVRTSMAKFPLCSACRAEYEDPASRRFHAEPIACPACGPRLFAVSGKGIVRDDEASLEAAVRTLAAGGIVAVKGIGGFHLLVDAWNEAAVERLRKAKRRPHKPLAVMFPWAGKDGLAWVRRELLVNEASARALVSPVRPIVLLPRRGDSRLPRAIAPGLREIGAMLPYSPLHHLLLAALERPVVATSANVSGEPVLTEGEEVGRRLAGLFDLRLDHDRPILRPADDSVMRPIAGRVRVLRLGRGWAPLERTLPRPLREPTLAVGGHMKNAIALGKGSRAVLFPHIGDLDAPRSREVFARLATELPRLYGVRIARLVCDLHPDYASTRWARRQGLPVLAVPHHHAHASALVGEHTDVRHWLVFTWDGVGLGEDGRLWGGEALWGGPGRWRRLASLRPWRLPGGEGAARQPWRAAAGLAWTLGLPWRHRDGADLSLLEAAWGRGLNAPETTAVGRLFDAFASLLGLIDEASFEGQGPMLLEAAVQGPGQPVPVPSSRDEAGIWRADWAALVRHVHGGGDVGRLAADVHASLAALVVEQALACAEEYPIEAVGLTGGVFQNAVLAAACVEGLRKAGFRVYLPEEVPMNDGGLAFGQLVEAACRS